MGKVETGCTIGKLGTGSSVIGKVGTGCSTMGK